MSTESKRVFILSDTKVKAVPVKAGETVKVDKSDFQTLVRLKKGCDPDTAEGKAAITKFREEQAAEVERLKKLAAKAATA